MKKFFMILACGILTGSVLFAQKKSMTPAPKTTSSPAAENVDLSSHGGLRMGYINSAELLTSMPEKTKADSDIAKFAREFQNQIESMMKEYQAKGQDFQAKEKTMSEAIKEVKMKEIQDLQNRIEAIQQSAREKVDQKKQDLYQPILEKADKAIKTVAKEKDFDYIFDANGTALLFGKDEYNITSLVKAKLGIK